MVKRRVPHFDIEGWPTFPFDDLRAYKRVWNELAAKALEKLQDGEWMAQGISVASGPQSIPIETVLWTTSGSRIVWRRPKAQGFTSSH